MKKRINKLIKKPFVRNVAVMATGTAAAQLVTMVLSPIITRLYGPEAFGIMGTFTAMIGIIAPIAALTYPIAIVLPKDDDGAKGIIKLSLIITAIMSFISLILLLLFDTQIVNVFNLNEISTFLYLIPLVIIFSGLMQVAEQWLIRTKQFTINARVTFLHSVVVNGSKIGIGSFYPIASVLVVLSVFGNGLRAFLMIFFARKSTYKSKIKSKKESNTIKSLAMKHYDFPVYRAPEVFISAVSMGLPVLMLTSFFGPASAGFYTIGRSVLSAPSQLIGKSVGDVFYPRIADAKKNNENLTVLIKQATLYLFFIGIVPFGLVMIFGPFLFTLVFGSEWSVAGEYARWIALMSLFNFINRPSVRALPVINAQRFHLMFTIVTLIIRVIALGIGYYVFSSDLAAIVLFCISGAVLYSFLITFVLKLSEKY